MARYRCPRCHEITYRPELFAFCGICSAPLTAANLEGEAEEQPFEVVRSEGGVAREGQALRARAG
jgi:hypothetical protein